MQPPVFPALRIEGEEELLLAPYRAATSTMAEALVHPGVESSLKAPALRGLQPDTVEAWDAAFGTLGLRWANLGVYSATDSFYCALQPQGFVPSQLSVSRGECNLPEGDRARAAAPLVAMAEWELFKLRGDRERLAHAFELLYADFQWREQNQRRRNGLLGGTAAPYRLASTGRFTLGGRIVPSLANNSSWVDACGMYALNLRVLSEMALLL
ncbi:MAG: hypothetical protein IT463_02175, partial [Planctomycetes bacterium]|nr:hypothetical protein [Planctomycetota bacterium]